MEMLTSKDVLITIVKLLLLAICGALIGSFYSNENTVIPAGMLESSHKDVNALKIIPSLVLDCGIPAAMTV